MREILFRGKEINRNIDARYRNYDWVYGLLTRPYDERFVDLPAEMTDIDGVSGIKIDHNTVGQYTGLTDMNGKKIFEGDVVLVVHKRYSGRVFEGLSYKTYVVNLSEDRGGWFPFACGDGWGACESEVESPEHCEIIGNIHDTPEFLEKEGSEWVEL
jgi:uncharacterized phage protein (TIGR01671 family)